MWEYACRYNVFKFVLRKVRKQRLLAGFAELRGGKSQINQLSPIFFDLFCSYPKKVYFCRLF